eukprot:SAG11_NODE_27572_length_331_cov_0.823276_1_plen_22_part_10
MNSRPVTQSLVMHENQKVMDLD